jgi:tetratricopeptide (TPR) repeat protein
VSTDSETEEGLERLRTVARSNPRSTAFVALAHALSDNGHDDEAEEVCRKGLLQHPRLVTAQVALGRALIGRGRRSEAKEVLVNAARSNPEHGEAFRWLGHLILQDGDADRARILLEYAEELMPSDARVAELLVQAGGKPTVRSSRPRSDFEHTRIKDARALADRMHEDPPTAVVPAGSIDQDRTPVVEPLAGAAADPGPLATLEAAAPQPSTPARRWPLRALALAAVAGLILTVVLAVALDRPPPSQPAADRRPRQPTVAPAPPRPIDMASVRRNLIESNLASLRKVQETAKTVGLAKAEPDLAAAVALADALLTADWGLPLAAEADEAATVAERARPPLAARTAVLESARAITAAANGRLVEARAAAERGLAASPAGSEPRFAAGRIKFLAGELGAARVDLERSLAVAPAFGAAAADHAAVLIDAGEAASASTQLEKLVAAGASDLRFRLLLAEAARAAARPFAGDPLRQACRESIAIAPLKGLCSLSAAADARLAGDRSGAVRYARGALGSAPFGPHSARGTAQAALMLASLGEIDAANEALDRIRDHLGGSFVPRVWAEAAIALGRGEKVSSATLSTPPSPEARLIVARMAFAQGGPSALAGTLGRLGAAAIDHDPELKIYSALAIEGRLSSRLRADLERRSTRGSAVAAYVLGRGALAAGDRRTAARRLAKALRGHGDTCEAARLLLTIDRRYRPSSVGTESRIARALKGRNAGCVHLRR